MIFPRKAHGTMTVTLTLPSGDQAPATARAWYWRQFFFVVVKREDR